MRCFITSLLDRIASLFLLLAAMLVFAIGLALVWHGSVVTGFTLLIFVVALTSVAVSKKLL